jgi:hypothetical protein
MCFADGAVRAGYNVQLAIDTNTTIILAVAATDRRRDAGLDGVMVEQINTRLGSKPRRLLADTTYATQDDIIALVATVEVWSPPTPDRANSSADSIRKRERRREAEAQVLKDWRARMADETGKSIY